MTYDLSEIVRCCQESKVGKLLPRALYVHQKALKALDQKLQAYEAQARHLTSEAQTATLVKFSLDQAQISYLFYPDFDRDPHPALVYSLVVNLENQQVQAWDYSHSQNPPVLHRKETFVTPDYPLYSQFAHLTQVEVALGLLDQSQQIGTRLEWEARLSQCQISFHDSYLVCPYQPQQSHRLTIARHRAAIPRKSLSRPVRLALEAELITPSKSFFDYGCGHGTDVEKISSICPSAGWDPYYFPAESLQSAAVVNLGYILNVIEDLAERRQALLKAWELTEEVLIVAAQVLVSDRFEGWLAYGDGIITSRNTFQKYYEPEELKIYIEQVLGVEAIPVDLGIYFVFRDPQQTEQFRLSRYYSRTRTPKQLRSVKRFEDYQELLQPLMAFFSQRGRLPKEGELANEEAIKAEFGSFQKAFKLIEVATDPQGWSAIAEQRRQDLLLYLALSRFQRRPKLQELPSLLQEDYKALWGSYKQACLLADMMLLNLGDLELLRKIAHNSPIGQKTRHTIVIHLSALEQLEPILRLYEGCASRTVGRLENANLIKFYFSEPKIVYLCCPDFDQQPHPLIEYSMTIRLGDLAVTYHDYREQDNPLVIHQKDSLVPPDYPHYQKFAQLTRQEIAWGLLDNPREIRYLQGWLTTLKNHGAYLAGHRLRWRPEVSPYQRKLLTAQRRARKP